MTEHRSQWIWICTLLGLPMTTSCGDLQLAGETRVGGTGGGSFQPAGGAIASGNGGRLPTGSGGASGQSLLVAGATNVTVAGGAAPAGLGGGSGQSSTPAGGTTALSSGGTSPSVWFGGASGRGGVAPTGGSSAPGTGGKSSVVEVGGAAGHGGVAPTGGSSASGTGGKSSVIEVGGAAGQSSLPTGGVSGGGGGRPGQGGCASGGYAGAGGCTRQPQLGDVDGDGDVDQQDASYISNSLLVGLVLKYPELADVDCDGRITESDANCVFELSQGLVEAFRCSFAVGLGASDVSGPATRACGLKVGDVDGDGDIDYIDPQRTQTFSVGLKTLPFFWVVADTRCDGKILTTDSGPISDFLTKGIPLPPCRTPADSVAAGGASTVPECVSGSGGSGGFAGASNAELALGDANGDGSVDLHDADLVAKYTAVPCQVSIRLEVADANCDSMVDLWDAKRIAAYALRQIDHLACVAKD